MQQLRGCFNKLVTYCEVIVQNLAREMPFDMKLVAGWGGGWHSSHERVMSFVQGQNMSIFFKASLSPRIQDTQCTALHCTADWDKLACKCT